MSMGRKSKQIDELVKSVNLPPNEQERFRVIHHVIAQTMSIEEAMAVLQLSRQRIRDLRDSVMLYGADAVRAKVPGRSPFEVTQEEFDLLERDALTLARRVMDLERELEKARVQREIQEGMEALDQKKEEGPRSKKG